MFKPLVEKKWAEKYLAENFFTRSYDRFQWWRGFTPKTRPLAKSKPLLAKIRNGDFNQSSMQMEAYLVEHKLNELLEQIGPEFFHEESSLPLARRKRLLEDFYADEEKKLIELRQQFCKEFNIDRDTYEKEAEKCSKDLEGFYLYMEKKYK